MKNRKLIKLILLSLMVLGLLVLSNIFYSKLLLQPNIVETKTDQIIITELPLDFSVRGKISDYKLLITGSSNKNINIYNLQSQKQSVLAEPYYNNNFIKSIASNKNWVVWIEDEAEIVDPENKPFKWSIIAQNITTSERFIIDSSSLKDNRFEIPLFINFTPDKISISDDNQVVYSKVDIENQVVISKLVLFDINTKTQKILSQTGPVTDELIYLPTIQVNYIAWGKFKELNMGVSERSTQYKFSDLYLYDIKTQETRQITDSDFYYAPSIYENKLVAINVPKNKPNYSEIILMDLDSGQIKSIVNSSSSNYQKYSKFADQIYKESPKINQNYVMWMNSGFSNRFIYNYLDQELLELYEDIEDNKKNNITVYSMFDKLIFMKLDSVDGINKHMCIKLS